MNDISFPSVKNLAITPFGGDEAIVFKTLDQAAEWLQEQTNLWQPFYAFSNQLGELNLHQRLLTSALQAVSRAINEGTPETQIRASEALKKLESPPYLAADGAGAAAISDALEKKSPQTAFVIFKLWIGETDPQALHRNALDIVLLLRAGALWRDRDRGLSAEAVRLKKSINARIGKWEGEFKGLADHAGKFLAGVEKESGDAIARQAEITTALESLHAQSRERLGSLEAERQEALDALYAHQKERLSDLYREKFESLSQIEEAYTEHMRMKAPADYWMAKANSHKNASLFWLKALLSLIGFGLLTLSISYIIYLYDWIEHFSKPNAGAAVAVLLGLPALLFLTLVRVAHKSYRDEVRHAVDAEQRTTLVQTYLALTADNDAGVQSGERLLALHALFRGSAQSDGPDDTPPVNTLEAIIQSLRPKAP